MPPPIRRQSTCAVARLLSSWRIASCEREGRQQKYGKCGTARDRAQESGRETNRDRSSRLALSLPASMPAVADEPRSFAQRVMSMPLLLTFISSCIWIGVAIWMAYLFSAIHTTLLDGARTFAGGLVASPAIGALIGCLARRFNTLAFGRRLLLALADLYLATYLFLLAAGVGQVLAEFIAGRAVDLRGSLVVGPLLGTVLSLTYTGFALALLPLSYLNHVVIGRAWNHVRSPSGAAS